MGFWGTPEGQAPCGAMRRSYDVNGDVRASNRLLCMGYIMYVMHSHSYLMWYIFICVIYQYNRLGQCMLLDTIHALISRKIHWRQVISETISMICVEIHWDKVLEHFSPDHLDHSIISLYSHSYLCWDRSCEFGRPAGRSGVCWDGRLRFGRWRSKAQTREATKGVWCYANRSFLDVADGNQFGHFT